MITKLTVRGSEIDRCYRNGFSCLMLCFWAGLREVSACPERSWGFILSISIYHSLGKDQHTENTEVVRGTCPQRGRFVPTACPLRAHFPLIKRVAGTFSQETA